MVEQEVRLEPGRFIVSKTDETGRIVSCNDTFEQISGYRLEELVGKPHNVVRHHDMPKLVFKLLWAKLRDGQTVKAFVKNRTKGKGFYWVYASVEPIRNRQTGKITGFCSIRKTASPEAIRQIEAVYDKINRAQVRGGDDEAKHLLKSVLDAGKFRYNDLVTNMQHGRIALHG